MIYIESGVGPVELKWLNIIGARNYSAISNSGSLKLSGVTFSENKAPKWRRFAELGFDHHRSL